MKYNRFSEPSPLTAAYPTEGFLKFEEWVTEKKREEIDQVSDEKEKEVIIFSFDNNFYFPVMSWGLLYFLANGLEFS